MLYQSFFRREDLTSYRHWSVCFTSISMMVVFWAITPFQTAIFASRTQSQYQPVSVKTAASPFLMTDQGLQLTSSFIYTANGVIWLREDLPSFTSRDYALEPIQTPDSYQSEPFTWMFSTTAYSSQLDCTPAILNQSMIQGKRPFYGFRSQDNEYCYAEFGEVTFTADCNHADKHLLYYLPYSTGLLSSRCEADSAPTALIIWAKLRNSTSDWPLEPYDISASFCQASYYSQSVVAYLSGSNHAVSSVHPTGSRVRLSKTKSTFTSFESAFVFSNGTDVLLGDYPDQTGVNLFSHLPASVCSQGILPVTSALGLSNYSIQYLDDATLRQAAFNSAFKLFFSLAVNQLYESSSIFSQSDRIAMIVTERLAFKVVRAFAILAECSLAFVAFSSLFLIALSRRRNSQLTQNLASIEDIIKLLPTNISGLREWLARDDASSKALEETVQGHMYKLEFVSKAQSTISSEPVAKAKEDKGALRKIKMLINLTAMSHFRGGATSPLQTTRAFGIGFVTFIFSSLSCLVALNVRITALDGMCAASLLNRVL